MSVLHLTASQRKISRLLRQAIGGGTANTRQSVINTKAQNPKLVLALGDYSYADTANCWFDIISPIHSIMKINIGNHEVTSTSLLDSYLNNFGLSSQYYSYAIANVHVLTMATEDAFETGSQQYNFVVNDLEGSVHKPQY